jgi:hypothetical protein
MGSAVIQHQKIQAARERWGEEIDEDLGIRRVQRRQFQEEPIACGGLDGTVPIQPRADVLHRPDGWDTARGEAPAADRQEADAAFVLANHPDRTGMIGRKGLREAGLTARLEGRDRLRGLLCGWAGPL